MKYIKPLYQILCLITLACYSTLSFAGLVLESTRVIYPAGENEVTLRMNNTGKLPVLAQSWIDHGDETVAPDQLSSVFVLTPPINRVNGGKGQTLRISMMDSSKLPKDKESVYYLNVLAIPTKSADGMNNNQLNIAFKTRIKLFYRPDGLQGSANKAPELLKWSISGNGVKASNPTPYYITISKVVYSVGATKYEAAGQMIAPGGASEFHFKGLNQVSSTSAISYSTVNDFGGFNNHKIAK
ncbi:fimbria/pilus periplasmic chaperone [Klebsiella aerogenes]|nr:fimbria/pilus periplasmic chaperone [Klebsiella aerogenes]